MVGSLSGESFLMNAGALRGAFTIGVHQSSSVVQLNRYG
jgi:hypothetical protein